MAAGGVLRAEQPRALSRRIVHEAAPSVGRHRLDNYPYKESNEPALKRKVLEDPGSGLGFRVSGLGFRVWGFRV